MIPARRPILRVVEAAPPVVVGRYARPEAVFLREQSAKMKNSGWEDQPDIRSWLDLAAGSVKYVVVTAIVVGVWLWFR